ncbi:MAG: ABC transporter permease subunit [Elusimicrobia bacterium]|nr:ABC transporter permease subunit [Elusimicrobiota bacterium]
MRQKNRLLIVPLLLVILALLLYPLTLLTLSSLHVSGSIFSAETTAGSLTLANYASIATDVHYRTALFNSIFLSLAVALFSIVLCLCPAWLFARKTFRGKRALRALFTLPMSFSGIIVGFLLIIMLGRIGLVPQWISRLTGQDWFSGAAYRFGGLIWAYIYFEIPRATLTLESSLRRFDFQLESAARSLGAGRWQRLRFVILPLLWPSLLSTFAVTFSVSLGSFGVALIASKRFSLLPVELFHELTGFLNAGLASAMGVTLVAIAFSVNYAMRVFVGRREAGR